MMTLAVGCSPPNSRTSIIVQLPIDQPKLRAVSVDDVFAIVSNTATQFGLTGESHSFYLSVGDRQPKIWLDVRHNDFPLVIDISERNIEYRSKEHRQLADALVDNLNKLELNASITYHTPDPIERGWLFYSVIYMGLGATAASFLWRRSVRKLSPFAPRK